VAEEADNGGFLSHSTKLSLDNFLPSFEEYAPRRLSCDLVDLRHIRLVKLIHVT